MGGCLKRVASALRKALRAKWRSDIDIRLVTEAIIAYFERCRYVVTHDPAPSPGPGYFPKVRED